MNSAQLQVLREALHQLRRVRLSLNSVDPQHWELAITELDDALKKIEDLLSNSTQITETDATKVIIYLLELVRIYLDWFT